MTSILSLPLHHLLFSVWAAHLPVFPICLSPPIWTTVVVSLGVGVSRRDRAMISHRAAGHGEAVLGCLMLFGWGKLSISLSTQNNCWGGRRSQAAALPNVLTASVSLKPQQTKPIGDYRVAELRLVWFLSAVVFWVHTEVAPAWLNASEGGRPGPDQCMTVLPAPCTACTGPHHDVVLSMNPSVHPSCVCDQLSFFMSFL